VPNSVVAGSRMKSLTCFVRYSWDIDLHASTVATPAQHIMRRPNHQFNLSQLAIRISLNYEEAVINQQDILDDGWPESVRAKG
jgi:hypothetical protein